jgi:hypothetical protein
MAAKKIVKIEIMRNEKGTGYEVYVDNQRVLDSEKEWETIRLFDRELASIPLNR